MLKSGAILAVIFFSISIARAQEYPFEASVSVGPAISRSTSGNQTTQTVTQTGVGLASFRLNFSRKHSAEFTYARLRNTQEYASSPFQYRIQDKISEFSGAYVFRPLVWHRFHPFLLAGAGVLRFNPVPAGTTINMILIPLPTVLQNRATFVYGGGIDYRITKHWGAKLQYRGLLYKVPDFGVNNLFTGATGNLSEPTLGVVFRF
jgi:opacity protein-like surface antigen